MIRISEDERRALLEVLEHGRRFGYGNLIAHLATAWARSLIGGGMLEAPARAVTASPASRMPFKMQDDLLRAGEWDETGARYQTADVAPLTPADTLRARLNDARINESHMNHQRTVYWFRQYKAIAIAAVEALEARS